MKNLTNNIPQGRLLSLDFFRGFTMFLLIGEFTELFNYLIDPKLPSFVRFIGEQLHHHPWHGLHFWDLVQPSFMFIVGVALVYSVANREKKGYSPQLIRKHAIIRSFLLLLLGWMLYCIVPGHITFRFQNVLAQMSFTYIVAFFLMKKDIKIQILVSFLVLIITEIIYRNFSVPGFNQPFTPDHNFGTWLDMQYGGEDLVGHWVSFNALPTTAHTIWGVLAGLLLISNKSAKEKFKILLMVGIAGVIAGYALDPVTPIIKRIATSSFVIVSGGWVFLFLAFSYWLIDMKKSQSWVIIFSIVGMNSLFIYLFAHVGGGEFIYDIIKPFSNGLFGWTGELASQIIARSLTWAGLWYICYWLYKNKLFIKI